MIKVEALVLKNLLLDEEYVRKALPFLKREYFQDTENKVLFDVVDKFFKDYNTMPVSYTHLRAHET